MSLLAIDVGSSTCKAVAFAVSGHILAKHSSRYAPDFSRPSFAEMDAERFWEAVCISCRAAAKSLTDPVRALCLSSHGETFVAVDSRGHPLSRAILNQDGRAVEQSRQCEAVFGRQRLFQITGHFAHPMYPIPKILWLRQHQPEVFESTARFVTLLGYLLQKMGLPPFVDYSLASRFLAFDIRERRWSMEVLNAMELAPACFPEPVPAGTIAGKLDSAAADSLGLPVGTPVVLGGHDQPCGALGAGVMMHGRVADSIGTYECLLAVSDAPSLGEKALATSLNSYCHVVPGKFVTLAYFPSGIMVQWFHDLLYPNGDLRSDSPAPHLEITHYAALEAGGPPGPTGLCITPHLIGTCNPEFDPNARAVIAGLAAGTGRAHIYKGILEGLACELALVTKALAEAVGAFDDIYATGGGTRSRLGLHLRAALTGRRIHVMACQEAVCLGTALLAGVAIGEYASLEQAVSATVAESAVIEPDPAVAAGYREQVERYRRLRSATVQQS